MDETVYEKSLQSTAYSNNTRVKYYDSRQANKADEWINDETLYSKLPYIVSIKSYFMSFRINLLTLL